MSDTTPDPTNPPTSDPTNPPANDASIEPDPPPVPVVAGTVNPSTEKTVLSARISGHQGIAEWELDKPYVVRLTRLCGLGKQNRRYNVRILRAASNDRDADRIPGRVGPGTLHVALSTHRDADSISIDLDCTPLSA